MWPEVSRAARLRPRVRSAGALRAARGGGRSGAGRSGRGRARAAVAASRLRPDSSVEQLQLRRVEPQLGLLALPARVLSAPSRATIWLPPPVLGRSAPPASCGQLLELAGGHPLGLDHEVRVVLGAHRLEHVDLGPEGDPARRGPPTRLASSKCSGRRPAITPRRPPPEPALEPAPELVRDPDVADRQVHVVAADLAGEEVHRRRADEAGHEQVVRVPVELGRRAHLLEHRRRASP